MEQGDLIQDRYVLEAALGKGGMASVWRALDQRLQRPVAIKFLAPQFKEEPEFLVRFFSEAQAVARISHPNVVAVLDFGEHEGSPYLVMEYASGGAVSDLTGVPNDPDRAFRLVRDAALGVGAAHELGIVHRDIKPGNIVLSDEGRAQVPDFGIAQSAVAENLTATGQVIGSPHYIAPEQATGQGAVTESDVYALGVVLYELLTGRPPFDSDNATAIAIAHVDEVPEPPSARAAGLSEAIDALVLRCLAKKPEDRWPDGNAFAAALEATMPSIATPDVPVVAPATVAHRTSVIERDTSEAAVVEPEADKRKLAMIVGAAVLLAALAWGALALALRDPGERAGAATSGEVGVEPDDRSLPSPSDTPVVEEDFVPTTPTPTPTASPEESGSPTDEPTNDGGFGGGGGGGSGGGGSGGGGGGGGQTQSPPPSPTEEPSESPEPTPS